MKKKTPFFPILGCLSGVASVVAGFVLSCSVKDTAATLKAGAISPDAPQNFDFYSYFFGSAQTESVDETALMISKLVELCGKGFGLILIMFGLFAVCIFGYKVEKALRERDYAPGFIPPVQDYPYGAPAPEEHPAENYAVPEQDYIAPDEGAYTADEGFSAQESGAYPPEENSPQ